VQRDVDRHHRRGRHENGVAIGRRAGDGERPGHAAAAWPVLDHERLSQPLLEPLPQQPRQKFGTSAGRKGHDEGDGTRGIGLRMGARARGACRHQRQQRKSQQHLHAEFPQVVDLKFLPIAARELQIQKPR